MSDAPTQPPSSLVQHLAKKNRACKDCAFCDRNAAGDHISEEKHLCRCHAPFIGGDGSSAVAIWPKVKDDDWCGEWVAR